MGCGIKRLPRIRTVNLLIVRTALSTNRPVDRVGAFDHRGDMTKVILFRWCQTVSAVVALLIMGSAFSARAAEHPNLVYILLDDAGFGDLGCYGQEKFATPHMDRLAAEGMRFTQHYSGCTVCAPTRCSLMTGMHTGHCYIRGNREIKPEGQEPLEASAVTIPRLLKPAGYATGAFGKWGLGAPGTTGDPARHFNLFYGYNCQREAHNYYPDHLWSNEERVELDGKTYSHDLIMEQAYRFIRQNRKLPFFAFLPVTIPHAALHVPESYAAPFRKKFPEFENVTGKYAGPEITNPAAMFAGMMTKIDEDVGKLLALLDELGIAENTVVMLSSDNGPHQEGGHQPDFFNSSGGLRGHKRDLYEGGIRAPFLVRWPGKIKAGSVSALPSAQWDILPTLCELAGVPAPKETDGISLVPTFLGQGDGQKRHEYLYWEFYEQGGRRAVRFGDWKAVQQGLNKPKAGDVELFDLKSDPAEKSDLAASHPDEVARALRYFQEAHTDSLLWTFGNKANAKGLNRTEGR